MIPLACPMRRAHRSERDESRSKPRPPSFSYHGVDRQAEVGELDEQATLVRRRARELLEREGVVAARARPREPAREAAARARVAGDEPVAAPVPVAAREPPGPVDVGALLGRRAHRQRRRVQAHLHPARGALGRLDEGDGCATRATEDVHARTVAPAQVKAVLSCCRRLPRLRRLVRVGRRSQSTMPHDDVRAAAAAGGRAGRCGDVVDGCGHRADQQPTMSRLVTPLHRQTDGAVRHRRRASAAGTAEPARAAAAGTRDRRERGCRAYRRRRGPRRPARRRRRSPRPPDRRRPPPRRAGRPPGR